MLYLDYLDATGFIIVFKAARTIFTAKRMITTMRKAALATARLSYPSAASPDVAARRAKLSRLDIDKRQLQQFTSTNCTIINTTTFVAAASAQSAAINEPAICRFKVLTVFPPRSLHHPAASSFLSSLQLVGPTSVATLPPVSNLSSATQREAPALSKAAY